MWGAIIKVDGRQEGRMFCGENKAKVYAAAEKDLRALYQGTDLELRVHRRNKYGKVFKPKCNTAANIGPEWVIICDKVEIIK